MDTPLHHPPTLPNGSSAAHPTEEIPLDPSSSPTIEHSLSTSKIAKRKNKKKKQILVSDSASSASSNNCISSTSCSQKGIKVSKRIRVASLTRTRRRLTPSDVDALGLPLGMSIAAVVAQVLERKSPAAGTMSMDNLSEMCKLVKAEKFKTQLQDSRQVELLKNCLDFLVAGLIMMLCCLAYGAYIYSHRRIVEAMETCSPYKESKSSWWMLKPMPTFNTDLQLFKCQIQVLSRMLFGVLLIGVIALLLFKQSGSSHQTMPLTFILLLLAVGCGCAGKFCIDILGGSGNHWLIYWEPLCMLHFFSSTFYSTLFTLLNGPILVAERMEHRPVFPYWMRKLVFYATLLSLPLLCGFMPFASPREWFDHFSDFLT